MWTPNSIIMVWKPQRVIFQRSVRIGKHECLPFPPLCSSKGARDPWKHWWSEVAQLCLTLCDPMDCSLPGSSVHGFQARILEWVPISFSRGSSPPRDWTQVSHIAGRFFDSLPAETPGKAKNTGENNLFLLQWIFLTQEWNQGRLHCRQILYQLGHKGSPKTSKT